LVLLALIGLTFANILVSRQNACPNGCSSHGACMPGNKCNCDAGWAGDDCSISITPLSSGRNVTATVGTKQWNFYSITTTTSLTVIVNQTGSSGDCDLYLQFNLVPTRSSFAYRDITLNRDVSIVVDTAGVGTWYIGVYGFMTTTYVVTAFSGNDCSELNFCNGHGRCDRGRCSCATNYMGEDCNNYVPPLVLGNQISGYLLTGAWMYFRLNLNNSANTLRFAVSQTSTGDVDLYVRSAALPTRNEYDYREIGVNANFTLDVASPGPMYYVGLRAFTGPISFVMVVTQFADCPSKCSKHGVCASAGVCTCNAGYSGQLCQTMTSNMVLNRNYTGFVSENIWNYYKYQTSSTSTLVVSVSQDPRTPGDCDLYIKSGTTPTVTSFDYADVGYSTSFSVSINNPGNALWYFGVYGYSTCDYVISATLIVTCPGNPPCSNNGVCTRAGVCQCNPGYAGSDCSAGLTVLSSGVTLNSATAVGNWTYFAFVPAFGTSYFQVTAKEASSVGSLWLFVGQNRVPDLRAYDYSDQSTSDSTSPYHQLSVTLSSPVTRNVTYYLGVYGNPFGQGPLPFKVNFWNSPF